MKKLIRVCLASAVLFSLPVHAQMLSNEHIDLSLEIPAEYKSYASHGSYMNPSWVGEVPEWHYYDIFGNKLLDGFYLFGMSVNGSDEDAEPTLTASAI